MDGTRPLRLLLAVTLVAVLPGCGRKRSEAQAAGAATTTTVVAEPAFDPMALRDMGKGLSPARGRVQTIGQQSVAVEAEPATMDFGVLPPGATVRGTVGLWNVGNEELTINESVASCGCTSLEGLPGRMIRAGGHIDFTPTMTLKSGPGEKEEKIKI